MNVTSFGLTDPGQVRDHNEDTIVVDPELNLYLVADGVGGGRAGEVASSMAAAALHEGMRGLHAQILEAGLQNDPEQLRPMVLEALGRLINHASEAVFNRAQADPACRGMATTLVLLYVVGQTAFVAHVGDSRLYMVRAGVIYQITEDHTLVQRLLQMGAIRPEEAATFPHRHVIGRSLGKSPAVKADTTLLDVFPGDAYVLCSDGLSDVLQPDEIRDVVNHTGAEAASQRLVATANKRGGPDNISAICVAIEGEASTQAYLRTEQKAGFLRDVFLFKDLNFQESMRVLTYVHEHRYSDGEVIIREGEYGDSFYILADGDAAVYQAGVYLTRINRGEHFGELGLLGDGMRSATVVAVGQAVVLAISQHEFYQLVSTDHSLAVKLLWGFLQNLAGRMKSLSTELAGVRAAQAAALTGRSSP